AARLHEVRGGHVVHSHAPRQTLDRRVQLRKLTRPESYGAAADVRDEADAHEREEEPEEDGVDEWDDGEDDGHPESGGDERREDEESLLARPPLDDDWARIRRSSGIARVVAPDAGRHERVLMLAG